jgi:hypothetical protein
MMEWSRGCASRYVATVGPEQARDNGAMHSYFGDRRHRWEWLGEQVLNSADVNWDPSLGQVCVIPVM